MSDYVSMVTKMREGYTETPDRVTMKENIESIKQRATSLLEKDPSLSPYIQLTCQNGQPMIMGSVNDGVYCARTFGLCLIGGSEIVALFPEDFMHAANCILRDLISATLQNDMSKTLPGRRVVAVSYGVAYKINECNMTLEAPIWQMFLQSVTFKGIEVSFVQQIADVDTCPSCGNFAMEQKFSCKHCRKMTYCSKGCRKRDKEHTKFCKAMSDQMCLPSCD